MINGLLNTEVGIWPLMGLLQAQNNFIVLQIKKKDESIKLVLITCHV